MKRLGVLRHAKSSWDDEGMDDFDRPLNDRGWKAARQMGKEMKHRRRDFDLGLASPAARVRETIDGLIEEYGQPTFPIRFEKAIYMADEDTLLGLIRAIPDDVNAALLIGHNPGLERLLAKISKNDSKGLRDRVAEKYPTAALAVVELPAKHWTKIEPGSGTIIDLILPKELD